MQNLLTRLARAAGYAPATKAAATSVTFYGDGRPVWSAREPVAFAREGYARNAVVHRCVRLVAEAAASLPLTLAGAEDDHPLIALLSRPNPREGGTRFLEGVYGHLMVSGNAVLWSKCTKPKLGRCPSFIRPICGNGKMDHHEWVRATPQFGVVGGSFQEWSRFVERWHWGSPQRLPSLRLPSSASFLSSSQKSAALTSTPRQGWKRS